MLRNRDDSSLKDFLQESVDKEDFADPCCICNAFFIDSRPVAPLLLVHLDLLNMGKVSVKKHLPPMCSMSTQDVVISASSLGTLSFQIH